MRILSVDWDYFILAPESQRDLMFPQGVDESLITPQESYQLWAECYEKFPELKDVRVNTEEFMFMCNLIRESKINYKVLEDSHKDISRILEFYHDSYHSIINVDHHHDFFDYGGDVVNCSNWLRIYSGLFKEKIWVKNEDSCISSLAYPDTVPLDTENSLVFLRDQPQEFDFLFLCRSSSWSPPHLDPFFNYLVKTASFYPAELAKLPVRPDIWSFDNFLKV